MGDGQNLKIIYPLKFGFVLNRHLLERLFLLISYYNSHRSGLQYFESKFKFSYLSS